MKFGGILTENGFVRAKKKTGQKSIYVKAPTQEKECISANSSFHNLWAWKMHFSVLFSRKMLKS